MRKNSFAVILALLAILSFTAGFIIAGCGDSGDGTNPSVCKGKTCGSCGVLGDCGILDCPGAEVQICIPHPEEPGKYCTYCEEPQ